MGNDNKNINVTVLSFSTDILDNYQLIKINVNS